MQKRKAIRQGAAAVVLSASLLLASPAAAGAATTTVIKDPDHICLVAGANNVKTAKRSDRGVIGEIVQETAFGISFVMRDNADTLIAKATEIKAETEAKKAEEEAKAKKAAEEAKKAEEEAKKAETAKAAKAAAAGSAWNGAKLTPAAGAIQGPSGKETYYNLPMQGVINIMRRAGYSEAEYPYHVREDGVKMLGPYIMVAANLKLRPRGTIYQTSLGQAIVCDTGGFAASNPTQTDIAVNW